MILHVTVDTERNIIAVENIENEYFCTYPDIDFNLYTFTDIINNTIEDLEND